MLGSTGVNDLGFYINRTTPAAAGRLASTLMPQQDLAGANVDPQRRVDYAGSRALPGTGARGYGTPE